MVTCTLNACSSPRKQGVMQGTIPYLGTFLTDLVMMDTAMKDYTEVRWESLLWWFLDFKPSSWVCIFYFLSLLIISFLLFQGGLINFEKRRKVNYFFLFVVKSSSKIICRSKSQSQTLFSALPSCCRSSRWSLRSNCSSWPPTTTISLRTATSGSGSPAWTNTARQRGQSSEAPPRRKAGNLAVVLMVVGYLQSSFNSDSEKRNLTKLGAVL